jgi:alkylation response protein AidB-like acyl-CoA dehydrogenase
MNLELSEDQEMLKDSLSRAFSKFSPPARIREAESLGHDAATWQAFVEMGLPLLRVQEEHGGAGASLMDAVVIAEVFGEFGPVVPALDVIVAARLLARLGGDVTGIAEGKIAVLALRPADGSAQLIAAAAAADSIMFLSDAEVRVANGPFGAPESNIGSSAARRIVLAPDVGELLASGPDAVAAYDAAIEEWKLLNAAATAAAARKAILLAADYAKERHAFGRPIGGYQGLAHPLAEAHCEVEGATLLVWRTVEALSNGNGEAGAMVRMSAWWAAEACRPAVIKAMRVFGGYGMTMEYDAQIYFRRVTQWSLLAGNPDDDLPVVADRLWSETAPALPEAGATAISFEYPEGALQIAATVRAIFDEHATFERREQQFISDDFFDPELYRKLAANNLLYPDWPVEHGGSACDRFSVSAIKKVFTEFDWGHVVISVSDMLGKMVLHFGSEEAKAEILPKLAAADAYASLGYSEPSCGSDIFAARTKAVRDGDEWVIDGQKMFTSQGHLAQYALMLTRTGEDKHGGITLFALPLDAEGYRCDEIKTIGNERTNTTFYEGIRVSDAYRLGEVDGGVKVLAAALTMEQGSGDHYVGAIKNMLEGAVEWARGAQRHGRPAIEDPGIRAGLARSAVRLEVVDVLSRRTAWGVGTGKPRKHYGPSAKLFGSESWVKCGSELMALAAPDTLLQGYSPTGRIEQDYRRSVPSTIYAGTSEVQRSIVAEAGLGLPRTRT